MDMRKPSSNKHWRLEHLRSVREEVITSGHGLIVKHLNDNVSM